MHEVAAALIEHFGMEPLPVEGTFFASTYRSSADAPDGGPAGTAIVGLYCDDPPSRSLFHRLEFDEVWHFYAGDPIRLVLLHPDGCSDEVILGERRPRGPPRPARDPGRRLAGGRARSRRRVGAVRLHDGAGVHRAPASRAAPSPPCSAGYPARADDIRRLGIPDGHETTMPAGSPAECQRRRLGRAMRPNARSAAVRRS